MKGVVRTITMILILLMMSSSSVLAAEKTLQKEYTFHSDTAEFSYSPKKNIKENGKNYKLSGITYEKLDEQDLYLSKKVKYTELPKKQVPLKKEFTIDGQRVTLQADEADIQYSQNTQDVTETLTGYTSQQSIPKQKTVSKDGKQYTATLVGIQERKIDKPVTINVKFIGEQSADFYFKGKKIKLNGNAPTWDGYAKAVTSHLDLPNGSTLSGGRWTTDWHKENGTTVRYAQFTGTRPASNYVVTYRYQSYDTTVTYHNDKEPGDKEYKVKAICKYEKEGLSFIQKLLIAGAGIAILAGLIAVILYIIRRRKKEL